MAMRRRIPRCESGIDRREFLGAALTGAAALSVPMPAGAALPGGSAFSSSTGSQIRSWIVDAIPDAGAWVELDRAAVAANLAAVRAEAAAELPERPLPAIAQAAKGLALNRHVTLKIILNA